MSAEPTGSLAGEFHPGDINEGPLPQRIPGATLGATWTPGDRFRIAARGDRFDGTTGRIRRLWTGGDGREHAHVTHDDGTYTTWPTSRLEKPTDPSTGVVTAPTPAPSDDATPSLVELDRREAEERVLKAALAWHATDGDSDFAAIRDTFWAMKDAIAEYAEVAR